MAINKNHEFEELDGVKCGIVEKNVNPARLAFLKSLLEFNGYTVIAVPSPAPKAAAPAAASAPASTEEATDPAPAPPPTPETYILGVTDYTFNPTNAIFGRALKTAEGQIVTLAYWQQRDSISEDETPYYERG